MVGISICRKSACSVSKIHEYYTADAIIIRWRILSLSYLALVGTLLYILVHKNAAAQYTEKRSSRCFDFSATTPELPPPFSPAANCPKLPNPPPPSP
ncbi:hypothetical protein LINGRAHAP2_LOCUS3692 [Linum grandiflorum]